MSISHLFKLAQFFTQVLEYLLSHVPPTCSSATMGLIQGHRARPRKNLGCKPGISVFQGHFLPWSDIMKN